MDGVIEMGAQTDLPVGRVFRCCHCGTRLKEGQPHTALQPYAHQSLTTLVISADRLDPVRPARKINASLPGTVSVRPRTVRGEVEAVDARADFYAEHGSQSGYVAGSHAGTTGFLPSLSAEGIRRSKQGQGRVLTRALEQGADGTWREAKA